MRKAYDTGAVHKTGCVLFFLVPFEAKDYISIDKSFRQCYIHINMKRYASYRSSCCHMAVEDCYK